MSLGEIALRAASPWPFKAIVDLLVSRGGASRPVAWLFAIAGIGLALQLTHQVVLLLHTRLQARLAQDMVFQLRGQLFEHFQYLSLSHHSNASTADAAYRLDADAGCLEHLHRHSGLRQLDRGRESVRPGADDDRVRHGRSLVFSGSPL